MKIGLAPVAAAFALALAPSMVMAQQLDFSAYGGGSASTGISFSLPADPVPDFIASNHSYFELFNVTHQQGGFSPCPCEGDFIFYIKGAGKKGGVDTPAGYYAGPQLFSGPITSPTFIPGDYSIEYINPGSFYNHAVGSLSITPAVSAVPEPLTWALLIAGFGAIGARMRSRRSAGLGAV